MSSLGSIFDPNEGGRRGEDLRFRIEVPRSALGTDRGYMASVPTSISKGEQRIERAEAAVDGGTIPLYLPKTFKSGSVLRLRGQGARSPGEHPGDLFLEIQVIDDGWTPPWAPTLPTIFWFGLMAASGCSYWLLMG